MNQRWTDDPGLSAAEWPRLLVIGFIASICGLFLTFALVDALPDRSECVSLPPDSVYVKRTGYWISHGQTIGYQPDRSDECVRVP